MRNHRHEYYRAWPHLTPPLRPHAEVVRAVMRQIGPSPERTLLLGVTPELADLSPDLVAIDINHAMITHVWPGNTASRRAVVADWRNDNFIASTFSTCVGDGSLSALRDPGDIVRVVAVCSRALGSGGKFVFRVYLAPDPPESACAVGEAAWAGTIGGFHAFKKRLAMALAGERPDRRVAAHEILKTFNDSFPDRDELVRTTGWNREEIDTIDFYHGSTAILSYPSRQQLFSVASSFFSDVGFVPSGNYEMAELCPLLVATKD